MALTITYVPGYIWTVGELITEGKLNLAANPTIDLEGSISSTSIADGAITTAKLAVGALSADATGRSKMADQFVLAAKLGSDVAGAGLTGGAGAAIALDPNGMLSTLAAVVGSARNLVAQNNGVTPNSKVTLTADEVLLKNSTGNPFLASAVNVTADITVSGANGLDTGSEAGSTWYYLWVIAKTDGTIASLLSTATALGSLTLPSGYVYGALVSAVRNDGSSNFIVFYQQDREIFTGDTVVFTAKSGVTSWTAISGADLTAMQGIVPPIARQAWGNMGNTANNAGMAVGSDATGLAANVIAAAVVANPILSYEAAGRWRVPLKTAQTVYYQMNGTSGGYRLTCGGFQL